jgi:hypothetical protein
MSFRCGWHRQLVKLQRANNRIEQQHTTPLIAKSGGHFMGTTFDLSEKPLDDIVRADPLPVSFRKRVKGQTGLQVALQAFDRTGIHPLVFLDESGDRLIGGLPIQMTRTGHATPV